MDKMEQENTDIKIKILKDGRRYPIRIDRRRFFYPNEWADFIKSLRDRNKPFYDFMINTGARFDETAHIRPCDFDFERNTVRLWKTKTKAKKGETHGKPRTISLSSAYARRARRWSIKFKPEQFMFKITLVAVNKLIKGKLKENGVKDYYNFSSHNIRKTHGMYLKALGIDVGEICTRLGHDYNTYIQHYGSADVFSEKDMRQIKELFGDLYERRRRY